MTEKSSNLSKVIASAVLVSVIGFVAYFTFTIIPNQILANTDDTIAAKKRSEESAAASNKAASIKAQLDKENKELTFNDKKTDLEIKNFGTLKIELKDKAAPKSVENFIRLVSRGYYNGLKFHRMTEGPGFNVIQGGDPKGDGTGGETANGEPLVDEIWEIKPEYAIASNDTSRTSKLVNIPKFRDPGLYPNYSVDVGQAVFPKGFVMMANTGSPDSNTSQFFITFDQTLLPANYTVFGVITDQSSLDTLDKIKNDVNPVPKNVSSSSESLNNSQSGEPAKNPVLDGEPSKDLKIEKISIL